MHGFTFGALSRASAGLVALCTFSPVWSQPVSLPQIDVVGGQDNPNSSLGLDRTSSTASRLGLKIKEIPASVNLIDRDTLEARGVRDTQEALRGVPGMTAAAPPGSAGSVFYRGFSGSQITQLFNGISAQYDVVSARPVDSWIYDRVESIGGPSTFLFGAGAVGGSINYLTKLASRDGDFTQAAASLGSHDTVRLGAGFNRRLGNGQGVQHFLRADVSRSDTNGYVDGNSRRATNGALSLVSDISPRLTHTLALEYQREVSTRPYWGTPVLAPATGRVQILDGTRFKNYNASDAEYAQTVTWARSILSYRVSDAVTVRNTLYRYDALRDFRNVEVYRFNADNSAVVRSSALLQRHDQQLTGNKLEMDLTAQLAGLQSDWSFGLDTSANRQTRFPRSLSGTVSTVDPVDFTTGPFYGIPGMTPGFSPDRRVSLDTYALYAENRTRLLPRLALVSGLRYDHIDLSVANRRVVTPTDPARFDRTYTAVTGRLGLVYDLSARTSVYVQASTAADPPAGVLTTANFATMRDFELTRGRQVEVGAKSSFWEGRGNATLAAYTITRKNLATADPATPGVTQAVGEQSSKGLEAAIGMRLTPTVRLQANYALVQARYEEFAETVAGVTTSRAGNRPANSPAQVANLWLDYAFAPGWVAGVDARYVSAVYGNAANTVSAAGYALFGARVAYRVNRSLTAHARVRNLTDKVYALNVTGSPMAYLGEPRTFEVGLSAEF